MDERLRNILDWKKYLMYHNIGGSIWTEFQKANKKKSNETYEEYRLRLSKEYLKSKAMKDPIIGKFDDIIQRLDIIISKMGTNNYIPPELPLAPRIPPPPPPPPPSQPYEKLPPSKLPKGPTQLDTRELLILELKKALEKRNTGSGIDIIHNPLSCEEIQRKIGCKFILYENMHKINDIRELLPFTLILYQLAYVGHFCCVFENSEGINFFDPLGYAPDDELELSNGYAPKHDYTYLVKLLSKSDKPIIYNEHKLQSKKTSTCGHWCSVRMLCSELYCDEFANCFKNVPNRDITISRIYLNL